MSVQPGLGPCRRVAQLVAPHGRLCSACRPARAPARRSVSAMADGGLQAEFYKHGLISLSAEHNPRGTIAETLKRLGSIELVDLPGPSNFVKPYSIRYELDGRVRRWDAFKAHGSVGALVYHSEHDACVVVRQFRPAVWAWSKLEAEAAGLPPPPLSHAFTYELCAGIIDKEKSLEEITVEEIREEIGFEVAPSQLTKVTSYNASVGIGGSVHHMYTCDVTEAQRRDGGGGLQDTGEAIEVLLLPLSRALEFAADDSLKKSSGLLFGLMWLLNRKCESKERQKDS